MPLQRVVHLIDRCADLCGGRAALGRKLGTARQNVTLWAQAKKPIPAPMLARMADIAQLSGEEARELLALSACENPANASDAEAMRRAFFGSVGLGGLVLSLLFSVAATLPVDSSAQSSVDHLYIVLRARLHDLLHQVSTVALRLAAAIAPPAPQVPTAP